jgi:hypothetical protein
VAKSQEQCHLHAESRRRGSGLKIRALFLYSSFVLQLFSLRLLFAGVRDSYRVPAVRMTDAHRYELMSDVPALCSLS